MGRDKAAICIAGEPLWQRQVATLRATGPAELFISGPPDGPFANSGIEILPDAECGIGPLAGITAALRRIRTEWLLVLAVDVPAMTPEFLRTMIEAAAAGGQGIVPCASEPLPNQGLEPLVAVYPRAVLAIAEEQIHAGRLKAREFAQAAMDAGLVRTQPAEPALFENWNTPGDVRG